MRASCLLVLCGVALAVLQVVGYNIPTGENSLTRLPPTTGEPNGEIIQGVYKYLCDGEPVYVGQCGSAGSTCSQRLGDHFMELKGFIAMQAAYVQDNDANIFADISVEGNRDYFNHEACIAKKCIDRLNFRVREHARTPATPPTPVPVLEDIMKIYVIPINELPGFPWDAARLDAGTFAAAGGPRLTTPIEAAEKTMIAHLNTMNQCNRVAGVGLVSNAFTSVQLNAIDGSWTWDQSTDVHNRKTRTMQTVIPAQPVTQRLVNNAWLTNAQNRLSTMETFVNNVISECVRQSVPAPAPFPDLILPGVYPCPPAIIQYLTIRNGPLWTLTHCYQSSQVLFVETESESNSKLESKAESTNGDAIVIAHTANADMESDASSESAANALDEATDRALIVKCLQNQCTVKEKNIAIDLVKARSTGVCPRPQPPPKRGTPVTSTATPSVPSNPIPSHRTAGTVSSTPAPFTPSKVAHVRPIGKPTPTTGTITGSGTAPRAPTTTLELKPKAPVTGAHAITAAKVTSLSRTSTSTSAPRPRFVEVDIAGPADVVPVPAAIVEELVADHTPRRMHSSLRGVGAGVGVGQAQAQAQAVMQPYM